MPRESSTRACLTLKSRQLEALRCLSHDTGAPVSELVRRSLDAFLALRVPGYVTEPGHAASPPVPTPSTAFR
jgi:hypothetical protein